MSSKAVDSFNTSKELNEDEEPSHPYNEDIINRLIELQIGSRSQIRQAMEMVNNKNNIEEIAEYLVSIDNQSNQNTHKQQNKTTEIDDKVTTLMSMGYDINSVKKALEISNNDTQIAAQYL
eukprot:139305_1